ncbi:hypothetical protein CULT_990002 [[Clostridium] ultunense Esp]|nr:hypothetical protein CULT_990002 [[Clostridium] ultunense Esp]
MGRWKADGCSGDRQRYYKDQGIVGKVDRFAGEASNEATPEKKREAAFPSPLYLAGSDHPKSGDDPAEGTGGEGGRDLLSHPDQRGDGDRERISCPRDP